MEEKITSENKKAEEYKESPLRGIKINLTEATAKVVKDNWNQEKSYEKQRHADKYL